MFFLSLLIYNVIRVPLLLFAQVAGLFNIKIRKTLRGRRRLFAELSKNVAQIPVGARRQWIHISSMGELEQGVPLGKGWAY